MATAITLLITSTYDSVTKVITTTDGTTYGTPGSSDTYLKEFTFRKASSGDEAQTLTADNGADNLITSWTNTPSSDGWQRSIIVPGFLEAFIIAQNGTFTQGDVAYKAGVYYLYIDSIDSTDDIATAPTKWEELTSTNAIGAVNQIFVDIFITQNTIECLEEEQIRLGRELLINPFCTVNDEVETKIRTWLDGSVLLFAVPDRGGAQKMIESVIDLCNC